MDYLFKKATKGLEYEFSSLPNAQNKGKASTGDFGRSIRRGAHGLRNRLWGRMLHPYGFLSGRLTSRSAPLRFGGENGGSQLLGADHGGKGEASAEVITISATGYGDGCFTPTDSSLAG